MLMKGEDGSEKIGPSNDRDDVTSMS